MIFFSVVLLLFFSFGGPVAADNIKVTILYDNYEFTPGTQTDWGFACLIEGMEKNILFDTGTNPTILWHNINSLKVDIGNVDLIVLSHEHGDHTGGLLSVLKKKKNLPVYVPASFSRRFVHSVEAAGGNIVKVDDPVKICENVHLSGEVKGPVNETSLILDTSKGLVVITGCAHPGVANIVRRSREIFNKKAYFVFGGFHLGDTPPLRVEAIIKSLSQDGVELCGATHCTGDNAIQIFKQHYGDNFIQMGTGKIIEIAR